MSVSRSRKLCHSRARYEETAPSHGDDVGESRCGHGEGRGLQERRTGDECEVRELLALVATLRRIANARPTSPTYLTFLMYFIQ